MAQTRGIYLISMVAETLDMHPQTLRKYERAGFVVPLRMGALRTYSDDDVERLRLIKHFVEGLGLNLAGVEMALSFTTDLLELRARLTRTQDLSSSMADSVRQVDRMLGTLGVRVVARQETRDDAQIAPRWFRVNPGESIEFSIPR